MKVTESKPLIVIILIALGTLAVQIPALSHLYVHLNEAYPHLATLAEGIVGIILVWIASKKEQTSEVGKTPEPAKKVGP